MKDKVSKRFGNPFGPAGTSAGYFLLTGGVIIAILISPTGLILSVLGAFIAFTHSSSTVDENQKQIKYANNLFGILSFGRWVDITNDMILKLKKYSGNYSSFSRSNRRLDFYKEEYRLYLCDKKGCEIMPVLRSKSLGALKTTAISLANKLDIIVA